MEVAVSGVQEEKRGGAGRTVKKQIKSKSSRREKNFPPAFFLLQTYQIVAISFSVCDNENGRNNNLLCRKNMGNAS